MTIEFQTRNISASAVLYKFKELQNYFVRTGEKVHLICYPSTEEITLVTAFSGYEGDGVFQYRVNMFKKSSGSAVNPDIIQHIHDNGLLKKVNNENLIFWYRMTASDLMQCITLEDFLKALAEYKQNGLNKASILEEYLAEKEVTETKDLVAA